TATASDLMALAKPRITALVVFTTAIGLWLAPHGLRPLTIALTLVGTVLIVAAANVLNMYLERDTDALMARTMNRPLPAHRMDPGVALRFGVALAAVSVPLLTFAVGALPGPLASIALVSYVLLYTPTNRQTATSLLGGARGLPGGRADDRGRIPRLRDRGAPPGRGTALGAQPLSALPPLSAGAVRCAGDRSAPLKNGRVRPSAAACDRLPGGFAAC